MRRSLWLMLLLVGCATRGSVGPPGLLLHSVEDARLPPAGQEAALLTGEEERAALGTARPAAPALSGWESLVRWNTLAARLGHEWTYLGPPRMARAFALLHVALYDSLLAASDPRRGAMSQQAAMAAAAYEVLVFIFPAAEEEIRLEAARHHAGAPREEVRRGWALGRQVGRLVVEYGRKDGSNVTTIIPREAFPRGPGYWTGVRPALPYAGTWKTWFIGSPKRFHAPPPHPYNSPEDLREVRDVYAWSLRRTPEELAIVRKWGDRSPSIIWNELLTAWLEQQRQQPDLLGSARAFALLNMAIHDAIVACWSCKYTYWTARPSQRIPGLVTVVQTPNFPSYPSGHATLSGAAAVVLGELFPSGREHFREQAEEAAHSRFVGGIHFRQDNERGLELGYRVGQAVLDALRESRG